MNRSISLFFFTSALLATSVLTAQSKPVAWWSFDEAEGRVVHDKSAGVADRIEGNFERGDAVRLCDPGGAEFAKGVINYTSAELLRIIGRKTKEIESILGYYYGDEIVHRDNMVISA